MKWLPLLTLLLFTQNTTPTVPVARSEITYRDGKCRVLIPVDHPRWERQWVNTSQGRLLLNRVVAETNGGRAVYLIGWHDLPKSTRSTAPHLLLDRMRDGLLSSLEGTLLSEGPCRSERLTGLECRIRNAKGVLVRARFFAVKERMYQVMVVGTAADMDSTDTQLFFTSFRLVP
jgi:hypothetical protein